MGRRECSLVLYQCVASRCTSEEAVSSQPFAHQAPTLASRLPEERVKGFSLQREKTRQAEQLSLSTSDPTVTGRSPDSGQLDDRGGVALFPLKCHVLETRKRRLKSFLLFAFVLEFSFWYVALFGRFWAMSSVVRRGVVLAGFCFGNL